MNLVNKKYKHFQDFLCNNIDNDVYKIAIKACSVSTFLDTLQEHQGKSIDILIQDISKQFGIDLNKYDSETKILFKKYLNYFLDVLEII